MRKEILAQKDIKQDPFRDRFPMQHLKKNYFATSITFTAFLYKRFYVL